MKQTSQLILGVAFLVVFSLSASAQSVTLFSVNKYQGERRKSCVTFIDTQHRQYRPCDVRYGALYVGDDLDWFESSGAAGNRSVIKDLGIHNWSDNVQVPVVAALPKLQPGEQRHVTIDASGAAGAPGANGAAGAGASRVSNNDGFTERRVGVGLSSRSESERPDEYSNRVYDELRVATPPRSTKKEPKVDPMFVKAIPGHMYVIHIVDDNNDFYAVFRVDDLIRGDSVLVSWKIVDSPVADSTK